MKLWIATVALAATTALTAHAADEKQPTAQQAKMATCNKEAGDKSLKGEDRKAFMKQCLSAKPADGKTAQQEKMKQCNEQAKGKTGDERKAFMKECLSKKA